MNNLPSTDEQIGGLYLALTSSQEIIAEIKTLKKQNPFATYARIIEEVETLGESVGISTIRRVFATGSESKAGSFSYEHILCPIKEALERLRVKDLGSPISPELVDALKSIILVQSEEIAMLQEQNEQLAGTIAFCKDQIQRKDTRMDRKDAIIEQKEQKITELEARLSR